MYARPVNVHCIRTSSVQATALPITQPINKFVVKRSFFNAPHTNLTVIFLKWIFFYFFLCQLAILSSVALTGSILFSQTLYIYIRNIGEI